MALIRQERAEAAKKREEEKAGTFSEIPNLIFITFHSPHTQSLTLTLADLILLAPAAKEQKKTEARK